MSVTIIYDVIVNDNDEDLLLDAKVVHYRGLQLKCAHRNLTIRIR